MLIFCPPGLLSSGERADTVQGRHSELVDDSRNGPKSLGLGFSTVMRVPYWKELLK